MVYKIRNKGFNNFSTQGMNSFRVHVPKGCITNPKMDEHVTYQVQITRYTGMRIMHNYRNISRACKQFMMGDRFLEQLMILTLKD